MCIRDRRLGALHLEKLQITQRGDAQLRGEALAEGFHRHAADGGHIRQAERIAVAAGAQRVHHAGNFMAEGGAGGHALPGMSRDQAPKQLSQLIAGFACAGVAHQHLHDLPDEHHHAGQHALLGGHSVEGVHLTHEVFRQHALHRQP